MNLQIATQIKLWCLIFNNHDENCYPVNKFDNVATSTTSGNFEEIKYFRHATS